MIVKHNIKTILFILFSFFAFSLHAGFDELLEFIRANKKLDQTILVQIISKKFPQEWDDAQANGWTIHSLVHEFIGEYRSKKDADEMNKKLIDAYNARLQSKKRQKKPPVMPQLVKPGLVSGLHVESGLNPLKKSCDLDDDHCEILTPHDNSCKLLALKPKSFANDKSYNQSFAITSQGDKVPGIKTLWTSDYAKEEIVQLAGEVIDLLKAGKITHVQNNPNLYAHTTTINGKVVSYEARIDTIVNKQDNSVEYIIRTIYPKAPEYLLHKVQAMRLSNSSNP